MIYKEMDIGTAKPKYPHHLINIVSLNQDFNVALYKKKALETIEKIIQKIEFANPRGSNINSHIIAATTEDKTAGE